MPKTTRFWPMSLTCVVYTIISVYFFHGKQLTIHFYAAESFATKPKERRYAMVHEDIVINITRLSLIHNLLFRINLGKFPYWVHIEFTCLEKQ